MKPALLIRDVWFSELTISPDFTAAGHEGMQVFLKLSQERDLDPGLLLPVHGYEFDTRDSTGVTAFVPKDLFHAHGTVWAPKYVGLRVSFVGTWAGTDGDVHVDYDVVDIPWIEWFVKWDFLDHVPNNTVEY